MTLPTLAEVVARLSGAGPQWRPTADLIAAELIAEMRKRYPAAPEDAMVNYGRMFVGKALQLAAQARAASLIQ